MNWIEGLDKRRWLIIGGVLIISLSSLFLALLRNPISYDAFWHLQMGRDWIENGLSPWIDHYSFTFNGHPISNPPVIFQALLHYSVSEFGLRVGLLLVKVVCYILILSSVVVLLRKMKAAAVFYALIVPVIIFLLQMRSLVRPELISYTFSVLALALYFKAKNRVSMRSVLPMILLILVWTNYHSSIVGFVIFAGFFLDCGVTQYKERAAASVWVKWLAWGLLLLLAGFVNPAFSHPMVVAVNFSPEWKTLITEYYQPFSYINGYVGIYAVLLLAIIGPVMALQQRKFGLLLVCTILAWSAATTIRMVTPAGIVITLITAHLLIEEGFPDQWRLGRSKPVRAAGLFCLLIICLTLFANVQNALNFMKENRSTYTRYPASLVQYMAGNRLSGPVFNDYGIGGYLIYSLAPHNQVYIDGRTEILYPIEHLKTHQEARYSPQKLRIELEKYSIDLVIMDFSQASHDVVSALGDFGLDFVDARMALYRRGEANFPAFGHLMYQPACWQPDLMETLEAERMRMAEILPFYSPILLYADFVLGYTGAADGREFLDVSVQEFEWRDEFRRFAGFRFLEAGEYEITRILFGGVTNRRQEDYLVASVSSLLAGEHELAAQILAEMAGVEQPWIRPEHDAIALRIYRELANIRALSGNELETIRILENKLENTGLKPDMIDLNSLSFCH